MSEMGVSVSAGQAVGVVLQGRSKLGLTDSAIFAQMPPYLQNEGLSFLDSSIDAEDTTALYGLPGFFQGTITVAPNGDSDTDTISAQVSQAYVLVSKDQPLNVSIPNVGGTSTGLGTPQLPGSASAVQASAISAASSTGNAVANFFSTIKSAGTSLLIGLAAVVIIVLLIVAFGPNVKHIAARI